MMSHCSFRKLLSFCDACESASPVHLFQFKRAYDDSVFGTALFDWLGFSLLKALCCHGPGSSYLVIYTEYIYIVCTV